jgi:hypothetical protein
MKWIAIIVVVLAGCGNVEPSAPQQQQPFDCGDPPEGHTCAGICASLRGHTSARWFVVDPAADWREGWACTPEQLDQYGTGNPDCIVGCATKNATGPAERVEIAIRLLELPLVFDSVLSEPAESGGWPCTAQWYTTHATFGPTCMVFYDSGDMVDADCGCALDLGPL